MYLGSTCCQAPNQPPCGIIQEDKRAETQTVIVRKCLKSS